MSALDLLLGEVRACDVCDLPLGPRPIVQVGSAAQVVIIGQAPGTKVHASGVPWDDASGDHLRTWMGIDREVFYDAEKVAIVPMGFCYPGKASGGDAPPRPECAPLWHDRLLEALPDDRLLILTGMYAVKHYLGKEREKTLTETVRQFERFLPQAIPLPHPSWRSKIWMEKNPWFALEVLPRLRELVEVRVSEV